MRGRPSKYSDECLVSADEYMENCPNEVPTIEGLAIYLKVATRTLYYWSEQHEEFLHTLDKIKEQQKTKLIDNGLNGTFNATIAKLMLANHGFHDKSDNTHSAPGGGPVQMVERVLVDTKNTNS